MHIQERYHAVVLGVSTTTELPNNVLAVAHFICTTSGTITITTRAPGNIIKLNAFPVTAGTVYPLYIIVGASAIVTLAGGASGTLTYDS